MFERELPPETHLWGFRKSTFFFITALTVYAAFLVAGGNLIHLNPTQKARQVSEEGIVRLEPLKGDSFKFSDPLWATQAIERGFTSRVPVSIGGVETGEVILSAGDAGLPEVWDPDEEVTVIFETVTLWRLALQGMRKG